MAETEPGAPKTQEVAQVETPRLRDLKLKVEFMQQELAQAQKELEQETAFGRYDATVPADGEYTYSSYIEQRPTEEAAKQAADANLTGQDYYDHKYDLVNKEGSNEVPNYANMDGKELRKEREKARELGDIATERQILHDHLYEDMGLIELAKEESRARLANDSDETARIRAALENHVMMSTLKKDEGVIDRDSERFYKEDMEKYEKLVERFSKRGETPAQHSSEAHRSPTGEGDPSARTAGSDPEKGEAEDTSKEKDERTYGGYFKGTKVSVARVHPHPTDPSQDMLEVVGEDSRVRRILASDFTTEPVVKKADTGPEASQADKEPGNGFTIPALGVEGDTLVMDKAPENKEPGKELVLRNPVSTEVVLYQADTGAEDEETQSRFERVKGWFKKERSYIQEYGAKAWWKTRWSQAMGAVGQAGNRALNYGVSETMSDEEREHRRKRNRVVAIAGVAALTIGGLAAAWATGNNVDAFDAQGAMDLGGDTPTPDPSETPALGDLKEVANLPIDEGELKSPNVLETQEGNPGSIEISDPIPTGGSGEKLFRELNIDISKWYNNEKAILEHFPKEFYEMKDGHVGITKPGPLSEEAQNFIKSLQ